MTPALESGALDDDIEMSHVQRKRTPSHPEIPVSDATESGAWEDMANADADENDAGHRIKAQTARPKRFATPMSARVRRSVEAVLSAQAVVALGILWWSVVATLLLKWLWFYKRVTNPLEKWLGDMKPEGEPMLVGLAIVIPFIVTGIVFYRFRPSAPRLNMADTSTMVSKFRAWRRSAFGGNVDSVDVVVLGVFALIQLNTLVGKLLIDQFNGKIAKSGILNRTGRALGMNGFYVVLLSIVLVSRRSFVHEFLHLSSERAAKYHVWSGNFATVTLVLHGVIYCFCWYVDGKLVKSLVPCFGCDAKQAYKSRRNFFGLVGLVVLLPVALASLERVRRLHFRRFTLVHCLNVLFVVSTCIHYYPAVFWLTAPMLTYVMYRIVSVFTRARSGVVSAHAVDDAIIQLQLRRDAVGIGAHDFVPGQYVYVKVDEISKNEWHPFTISSSPSRDQMTLSLDIKVQGPFTMRLLRMIQNGTAPTVQLDGYYGTGIETTRDMVFIAGGSGVTPFLSLLEHFVLQSRQPVRSTTLPHRVWIVWTARDLSLLHAHMALLNEVQRSSAWKANVWLHWTGAGDMEDHDDADRLDKPVAAGNSGASASVTASQTVVFATTVVGAVLGMALVLVMPTLSSVWWIRRLSLLAAGVLGAMGGASTALWRSLPSRAGFERVDTNDVNMAPKVSSPQKSITSIPIRRSRPAIDAVLRDIHEASREESDIRVVVSGPSGLQHHVVAASYAFRSPFLSVECRSFAL